MTRDRLQSWLFLIGSLTTSVTFRPASGNPFCRYEIIFWRTKEKQSLIQESERDGPDSVPDEGGFRTSVQGCDRVKTGPVANQEGAANTAQYASPRTVEGREMMGSPELEWDYLIRWGLLKSPLRWTTHAPDKFNFGD